MFSSRSSPKSFTKFPKLPLEIQRLVWKFASFERRHVPVAVKRRHHLSKQVTGEDESKQLVRFRSDTPIPTLFSVCQESRLEAKRYYKKTLVAEHNFRFFSISLTPRFYINPHCDVICPVGDLFGDVTVMLVAAMHKAQCQSIALDQSQWGELADDFNGPVHLDQWLTSIVRPPHALKLITLYAGANYGTPYKDGSRGFPHTISSVDWNTIRKTDKCTLGVVISDLHRSITRYRDLVPKMVQDRRDVEKGLADPPTHQLLARLPVFHHLSTEVLEKWTPPRLRLLMHAVPESLGWILRSKNPFEVWHCGVEGCPNCPSGRN
ncbi:uncharacterized protein Bfra_003776 [Botrytis fragariae]|uniref:2EXR domain-containing protein n=1 Tax=Botrytis fragariae TaxID=1964551 RepID=A0A8H6AX16_9HELO|nr:uncharacterized protein Bfra_003776 [Botrytis fragariae]KAF5875321.1 hypothetical protein Bfra_003776 [Botrytis fragariae]